MIGYFIVYPHSRWWTENENIKNSRRTRRERERRKSERSTAATMKAKKKKNEWEKVKYKKMKWEKNLLYLTYTRRMSQMSSYHLSQDPKKRSRGIYIHSMSRVCHFRGLENGKRAWCERKNQTSAISAKHISRTKQISPLWMLFYVRFLSAIPPLYIQRFKSELHATPSSYTEQKQCKFQIYVLFSLLLLFCHENTTATAAAHEERRAFLTWWISAHIAIPKRHNPTSDDNGEKLLSTWYIEV